MSLTLIIIWSVVAVLGSISAIWLIINVVKTNREIKQAHADFKIMNKHNVDDFIKSKQWHDHLKTCSGKKHSKCVTINSDETI